jgi:hypothetical protein
MLFQISNTKIVAGMRLGIGRSGMVISYYRANELTYQSSGKEPEIFVPPHRTPVIFHIF